MDQLENKTTTAVEHEYGASEIQVLEGDIPSPVRPPKGCKFHTRCSKCMEVCKHIAPDFQELEPDHFCACHLYNSPERQAELEAQLNKA